jgi:hypothetical protein
MVLDQAIEQRLLRRAPDLRELGPFSGSNPVRTNRGEY